MALITPADSYAKKYLGDYANSSDFLFQELLRTTDLAIRVLASKLSDSDKVDAFSDKGWGQVMGAAYLLEANPIKISEAFKKYLKERLIGSINKGADKENPFLEVNVREFMRPLMMHPTHPTHPGKYLDWQRVDIKGPATTLNQLVKEANLNFSLDEGKLFLNIDPREGDSNIFDKLWKPEFAKLLESKGYTGLEKNNEPPHITLINSEVIAKIQETFTDKHGELKGKELCNTFFKETLSSINKKLQQEETPIDFTELTSTYSEDHSQFEEVIVAKLHSSYTEQALEEFIQRVKDELQLEISVKPKSSYHLTIAIKYRKPNPDAPETLQTLIDQTGEYKGSLNTYWEKFSSI